MTSIFVSYEVKTVHLRQDQTQFHSTFASGGLELHMFSDAMFVTKLGHFMSRGLTYIQMPLTITLPLVVLSDNTHA